MATSTNKIGEGRARVTPRKTLHSVSSASIRKENRAILFFLFVETINGRKRTR